jgi:hypothetical protein
VQDRMSKVSLQAASMNVHVFDSDLGELVRKSVDSSFWLGYKPSRVMPRVLHVFFLSLRASAEIEGVREQSNNEGEISKLHTHVSSID